MSKQACITLMGRSGWAVVISGCFCTHRDSGGRTAFVRKCFGLIKSMESCLQALHKEPHTVWHGQGDSVGREALVEGQ